MNPFICILSIFLLSSCAHKNVQKASVEPGKTAVSGDIVNASRLNSGGKLGLAVFKAGPGAQSDEQLDQISLMLIKGINERLQEHQTSLIVTDDEDSADLILQGYVEEFFQPGKFDRWVKHKNRCRLSVSGEIWQRDTGTKVLTFASSQTIPLKAQHLDIAYRMGQAIGDFILRSYERTVRADRSLRSTPLSNLQQNKQESM